MREEYEDLENEDQQNEDGVEDKEGARRRNSSNAGFRKSNGDRYKDIIKRSKIN